MLEIVSHVEHFDVAAKFFHPGKRDSGIFWAYDFIHLREHKEGRSLGRPIVDVVFREAPPEGMSWIRAQGKQKVGI